MDVFRAATRVVSAAAQQRQLEHERKLLAELRAEAMSLRAQIGEEMFKLWKAKRLPPSWLDTVYEDLDSVNLAVAHQREIVTQLVAGSAADGGAAEQAPPSPPPLHPDQEPTFAPGEQQAPAPVVEMGPRDQEPQPAELIKCPHCGAADAGGRPFCAFCGGRLTPPADDETA